jgi:hypothetical protein
MAVEYQYAAVPSKLKDFLGKIQQTGIPDKATYNWLETLGYKSTNDRGMVRVLNFIGFIDSNGKPTDYWQQYRGPKHRSVLATATKEGYSELYSIYPEAHNLSETELDHFFSMQSTAGKQVISRLVRTFITLCELADFSSTQPQSGPVEASSPPIAAPSPSIPAPLPVATNSVSQLTPSLHIDVQIHISADASPEQIDQIFASMAKHLYNQWC